MGLGSKENGELENLSNESASNRTSYPPSRKKASPVLLLKKSRYASSNRYWLFWYSRKIFPSP